MLDFTEIKELQDAIKVQKKNGVISMDADYVLLREKVFFDNIKTYTVNDGGNGMAYRYTYEGIVEGVRYVTCTDRLIGIDNTNGM
jgi:hypothetical protein